MRSNLDGTFLDADRRPRPPARSGQVPAVPAPRPVSLRSRVFPYATIAVNAGAAGLAGWLGQDRRWGWLMLVGLVLGLAACTQVALLVVTELDPDRVRRRETFAMLNAAVLVLTDGAVLAVVAVAWWMQPSDLLRWVVAAAAAALVLDLAWTRPWRLWLRLPPAA